MSKPEKQKRHPEPAYIPTKYLLCRNAHSHQFVPKVVQVVAWDDNGTKAYEGDFKCRLCGLPKTEWVNPDTGEFLGRVYGYSRVPGYLLSGAVADRKAFNMEVRKETFWRLATGGQAKKGKKP